MLLYYRLLHVLCQLCLVSVCLRAANAKTIDEIIAGSTKDVTDFDFKADFTGNVVRAELDMMLSQKQYQALYSSPQTSRLDVSSKLSRKKRKAKIPVTHNWSNKEIPYKIEKAVFSLKDTEEIIKAIQDWELYTCIRFRQATISDSNFVSFEDGTGCSSFVGMKTGRQSIILENGCRKNGVIAHEIGHAIGFYHEHSRPDRDHYIIIQRENFIHPDRVIFHKYTWSEVSTYNVPYDYSSIMHYGGRVFSGNGQYTIKTIDPAFQEVIGNREVLSFNDIKLANLMYTCSDKCNPNIVCPGDGFVGKDCRCWCRDNPVQLCLGSDYRARTQHSTLIPSMRSTVQLTSIACKDMDTRCFEWALKGYCQTNNYVQTNCKDSCSLCCRDVKKDCQYWKEQGYCTGGMYEVSMSENCPLSCGKCKISFS